MVNLDQAWAENYRTVKPDVSVQIAGGGSGVGIAGLIDGILDIAASSRKMEPAEIERATKSAGSPPQEFVVGLGRPRRLRPRQQPVEGDCPRRAGRDLRGRRQADQVVAAGGQEPRVLLRRHPAHRPPEQLRYLRLLPRGRAGPYPGVQAGLGGPERLEGRGRAGVAARRARSATAAWPTVPPALARWRSRRRRARRPVPPTLETALDGTYPISRPLYFYSHGTPTPPVKEFIDWTLSDAGPEDPPGHRLRAGSQEVGHGNRWRCGAHSRRGSGPSPSRSSRG